MTETCVVSYEWAAVNGKQHDVLQAWVAGREIAGNPVTFEEQVFVNAQWISKGFDLIISRRAYTRIFYGDYSEDRIPTLQRHK